MKLTKPFLPDHLTKSDRISTVKAKWMSMPFPGFESFIFFLFPDSLKESARTVSADTRTREEIRWQFNLAIERGVSSGKQKSTIIFLFFLVCRIWLPLFSIFFFNVIDSKSLISIQYTAGFKPTTSWMWVFCPNHSTRLLALKCTKFDLMP